LCVNYFDATVMLGKGYGTTAESVAEALRMVGVADAVTCSSAFIAGRASAYHGNVHYLADSIDRRHFSCRKVDADFGRRPLRAVWSGVSIKFGDVRSILALLGGAGLGLTVISDHDPMPRWSGDWLRWKRRLRYRFIPWHYASFPRDILQGDICVSPRFGDNPYDKGHSVFKIAVFMSEGVPALASPLPSYGEIVGENRAGSILCDTERVDSGAPRPGARPKPVAPMGRGGPGSCRSLPDGERSAEVCGSVYPPCERMPMSGSRLAHKEVI